MTRRGRRGGGTVFYDSARGRYVGQVSYIDEAGKRQRPKVYAKTEDEAWGKLDDLRGELKTTGTVAPKDLTVAHAIDALIEHPPSKWKSPLTVQGNKVKAEHIKAGLGKVKLAKLTVDRVERFLDGMAADGMSTDTINRHRNLLRLAIRRVERDGKISRNVAALADPPAGTRRVSKAMTVPQTQALLKLCSTCSGGLTSPLG